MELAVAGRAKDSFGAKLTTLGPGDQVVHREAVRFPEAELTYWSNLRRCVRILRWACEGLTPQRNYT